jgi:hypothetical protein
MRFDAPRRPDLLHRRLGHAGMGRPSTDTTSASLPVASNAGCRARRPRWPPGRSTSYGHDPWPPCRCAPLHLTRIGTATRARCPGPPPHAFRSRRWRPRRPPSTAPWRGAPRDTGATSSEQSSPTQRAARASLRGVLPGDLPCPIIDHNARDLVDTTLAEESEPPVTLRRCNQA